jgi:hypothetical protein
MIAVGTRRRAHRAMALALLCASLLPDSLLGAEPEAHTLHIASQPLDRALQEFARQTGVQIIFFSHLTDAQRAPALDGTYTVNAAINVLLTDSMLTFRWVNANTIEIRPLQRRTDRGN